MATAARISAFASISAFVRRPSYSHVFTDQLNVDGPQLSLRSHPERGRSVHQNQQQKGEEQL